MKVYVAGGSDERDTVAQPMIDRLRAAGVEITHDWTRCEGYERDSATAERAEWARQDLEGVRAADIVWMMVPAERSTGASAEFGAALALRKRVIVSGPQARGSIFFLLAEHFRTHEEAFTEITAGSWTWRCHGCAKSVAWGEGGDSHPGLCGDCCVLAEHGKLPVAGAEVAP